MFNIVKKSSINLWLVFSKVKYALMIFIFGFLFYFLNFLITAFSNIMSFYKAQGLEGLVLFTFNLFVSFKGSILLSSFVSMVVLSILTGLLFSLVIYKVSLRKKISSNTSILGGIGMFLGIFAPGCAACGLGLVAFFGLATSFATLPLKGLEISIVAIIILVVSIFKFSSTLNDDSCFVDYNHKSERRF